MKNLKDDIFSLKKDIVSLSNRFDHRLQAMSTALEADYKQRMSNIALTYQTLSALTGQIRFVQGVSVQPNEQFKTDHGVSSNAAIPKEVGEVVVQTAPGLRTPDRAECATILSIETETESSSPKPQLMSPLMTLSGIATAMINNASEQ